MTETKKVKGRGWHGDSQGHAAAGRKGGKVVAMEKGSEFFSQIGRKGGKISPGKFKKDQSEPALQVEKAECLEQKTSFQKLSLFLSS